MNITDELIDAIFGLSPFYARETMDGGQYEVIHVQNEDYDNPKHHGYFASSEEANTLRRRLHTRWVLAGGGITPHKQELPTANNPYNRSPPCPANWAVEG